MKPIERKFLLITIRTIKKLDEITKGLLSFDDELLILDCHSFSDKMASYFFKPPFPDICIGIEKDFFDEEILHRIIEEIKKRDTPIK